MSKRTLNIISGIAALVFGGLLYILFREDTYISVFFQRIFWVRKLAGAAKQYAGNFLKYYLQDFLWAFSLGCLLHAVLESKRYVTILCGVIAFLCGCAWELLQRVNIVSGTYDLMDIAMYFLASVICVLINLKERDK